MNTQETQRPQIDPSTLPWIDCSCGSKIFTSGVMVKKLSALLSPSGKEEILPVEVIICSSCNKIPEFYAKRLPDLPEDMIAK